MKYITQQELMEQLNISRQALYAWRRKGLTAYRSDNKVLYDVEEVKDFLKRRNDVRGDRIKMRINVALEIKDIEKYKKVVEKDLNHLLKKRNTVYISDIKEVKKLNKAINETQETVDMLNGILRSYEGGCKTWN